MKSTIVPAQVTTTEDKIIGSISVSQLVLLIAPIFIGGMFYVVFPPVIKYALYKLIVLGLLFVLFGSMAIRIRGKLIIQWLIIFKKYNLRPRYFIFDKNTSYLRSVDVISDASLKVDEEIEENIVLENEVNYVDSKTILGLVNPRISLRLRKKGGFYVTFSKE